MKWHREALKKYSLALYLSRGLSMVLEPTWVRFKEEDGNGEKINRPDFANLKAVSCQSFPVLSMSINQQFFFFHRGGPFYLTGV